MESAFCADRVEDSVNAQSNNTATLTNTEARSHPSARVNLTKGDSLRDIIPPSNPKHSHTHTHFHTHD